MRPVGLRRRQDTQDDPGSASRRNSRRLLLCGVPILGGEQRYALAFFCDSDIDWPVAAVPTCVGPDKPPKYPTTYYTDYMIRYQQRTYGLPAVQTEFGIDREAASLPYTAVTLGFVVGGPTMGWLADRFGIAAPVAAGAVMLGLGFGAASQAAEIWQFTLAHGLLIGIGGSASFGPVIADISLWFERRRGIAVAICASGSYLAGATWPLIIQPLAQSAGWRPTYLGIGLFCTVG